MYIYSNAMKHHLIPLANLLEAWLKRLDSTEPPPPEITGYNFGLSEVENGYSIYLSGSKTYLKWNNNWIFHTDYSPKDRHLPIPADYDFDDRADVRRTVKRTLEGILFDGSMEGTFIRKAKHITTGFDHQPLVQIEIENNRNTTRF